MIDFLFSFNADAQTLAAALTKFRPGSSDGPKIFSGDWGALVTIGTAYDTFDPIETEDYLFLVLGGPLPRSEKTAAEYNASEESGSRWILNRWKQEKKLDWAADLVGHFLVLYIDKANKSIELVTDIASFVPVYHQTDPTTGNPLSTTGSIGSHADALACATGEDSNLDFVSITDFLIFKTVTVPYSFYSNIRQIQNASRTRVFQSEQPPERQLHQDIYWSPRETNEAPGNMSAAAAELRQTLIENMDSICRGQKDLGLLMSGGEDSRVVASLIPQDRDVKAVTFIDTINREADIADTVCKTLGIHWEAAFRKPSHYIDHAETSVKLCESHNFFIHAHANGLLESLPIKSRILGALAADIYCKSARVFGFSKAGLLLKPNPEAWRYIIGDAAIKPDGDLESKALNRRQKRNEINRELRPQTWAEWHTLQPATMSTGMTNLIHNRRLFMTYEPFADSAIVRFSAIVPQKWKLNRKLFAAAVKPILRLTKWVPHGSGFYPYFGLTVNWPVTVLHIIMKKLVALMQKIGVIGERENPGPWQNFDDIVGRQEFSDSLTIYKEQAHPQVMDYLAGCSESDSAIDKLALYQVILWSTMLPKESADR